MDSIYHDILRKYWGYESFRPLQLDIIRSVDSGKDTLGLLPTGGGKSLTFQVPALAKPGICLVITPLIALMRDQVDNLKRNGIKAYAIHSGMSWPEIEKAYDNCTYGDYKFLYLSPERLATKVFTDRLQYLNVNLIAVDEAHCISQWGYDFRPSYRLIAEVREHLPGVPVLALTATATPAVVKDIQQQLKFPEFNVYKKSFERSNLAYVLRYAEDKEQQLLNILDGVEGSAIVYVRSRKKTRELAGLIENHGISAGFFHAGLLQKNKDELQKKWKSGQCRVIVATNAFGMGIDKADVRLVVHVDAPDSLEAYFQEAGRAGRDEKKAYAVFLWSPNDKKRLDRSTAASFPEIEVLRRVYDALGNFFQIAVGYGENQVFDFNIGKFCSAFGFNVTTLVSSLKILQRAGYIDFTEMSDIPSRVLMKMSDLELYKFQVANERLDPFIKVLLRSYTGLFVDYVNIDEELLAKRLNVSRSDVYEAFKSCSRMGVLHYIPQRRSPLIRYLQQRFEPHRLRFPDEVYKERLHQYQKRVEAVIDYASSSSVCRSRLLLNYFGEKCQHNCGHCDVCISRKKSRLSDSEFESIENAIKEKLENSVLTADVLVKELSFDEDKIWKVIRWLEDAEKISEDEVGALLWKPRG